MATHLHRQAALWHQQQAEAMSALLDIFRNVCAHGGADTLTEVADSVRDVEELRADLGELVDRLPLDWRDKVAEAQANIELAVQREVAAAAPAAPAALTPAAVADFLKNLSPEQAGELKVLMADAPAPAPAPGAGEGAPGGAAPGSEEQQ